MVTNGNVCYSMSGHKISGRPQGTFYCATKFALTALTEGVRCELRQMKSKTRITVNIYAHRALYE
jgi:NAD(P)-dependent dehydrogenase (short-subunit alcohol dehydrogenase family)